MFAQPENCLLGDARSPKVSVAGDAITHQHARRGDTRTAGISGMSVLLSDEHYKHTLGLVRHLGRLGARVSIVGRSKRSLAWRSRYCSSVILSPESTVEALVETTLAAVRTGHFDLVIPVSFPMTLALAWRRERITQYAHLELATREAIERAADKIRTADLAGKIGVPVPKTLAATEADRMRELSFPVVIKVRKETPGRPPVRYARDWKELDCHLNGARNHKAGACLENLLVQEYIPGEGCGFFATYQQGVCKRVFMHRRVREYPASGGVSSCAESFYDSRLEQHGRRMLDALDWHGVAMVEFRRDARDGEYKLLEINPKFWGSLDLAFAAGADFASDLCQMALGRDLQFTNQFERNLRFQWPFSGHGELFHLWTRPQSILEIAKDLVDPAVKSNVWFSDFRPNLEELRSVLSLLFRGRKG